MARGESASLYCYRFARMSNLSVQRHTFTYPPKDEYNPRTVFDPVFGIHVSNKGPIEDIEVVLSGAWAKYARDYVWHSSQQTAPLDDGRFG